MKLRKILATILSIAMVLSTMGTVVFAEDAAPVEVTTYEELIAALAEDSANVIMMDDITATATQSSGYGKAGIVLDAGDVLDGNSKTLTINGANSTWDTVIAMRGGEVKNLTIAGAMRGVFMPGANGDVVIDNCVFKDVIYTFNSDAGSKEYTVTVKNSTLNGWTSFSDVHKSVTFENCTFGEGSGYKFCRPYQPTEFNGCEFNEGFEIDTKPTAANSLVFDECKYNGAPLSSDNGGEMFFNGGSVVIDDEYVYCGTYDGTVDTSWYNDTDTEFVITTPEQLAGLAKLVDEWTEDYDSENEVYPAFKGITIKLGANINLNNVLFNPIGSYRNDKAFSGTFDGCGYTISNLSQNTWELNNGYYYSDLGLGLFGLLWNTTIKNLTINGAEISGESAMCGTIAAAAYGDCIFDNITIANANVADYQYYAGGIVGWASGNHQYINCNIADSTTIAAQWGDFDNSVGGVIGGSGSSATILMKNCNIACRIDAYNDVTSSYQWYAYRRAGMLVGNSNITTELEGTTYAVPNNFTVENCKITIGEWGNYTYCEFAGTSWPWVRVQEGISNSAYSNPRYGHPTDANGNEVVDDNHVHNEGEGHFVLIPFTQLFGGGQGVYGASKEVLEEIGGYEAVTESLVIEDIAKVARAIAEVEGELFDDLQAAIDATNGSGTVTLLKNATGNVTIAAPQISTFSNSGVTIDFNNFSLEGTITVEENATATIKNGTIINKNDSNSAIESVGTTTIENVTIKSARHGVRVEGGVTTINGGSYSIIGSGKTQHAVNVSDGGEVIIYDGTFTGPGGTSADSGSAVCVQAGSKVTIYGGEFTNGKLSTLAVKENATLEIYGGVFDQDPSAYVVDGLYVVSNNSGSLYTVTEARTITLVPSKEEVKTNEEFTVDIMIDCADTKGVMWTLDFDETYFELVSITTPYSRMNSNALAPEIIANNGTIDITAPVATYTLRAKNAAVENSPFDVSNANIRTGFDAWEDIDVSGSIVYENTYVTVLLREYEDITVIFDGEETAETEIDILYDGEEHTFEVTTSTIGATVTYTVNGGEESSSAPYLTGENTYEITYKIDGVDGYAPVTGTVIVTIGAPIYKVEVAFGEDSDYVHGMKLVLVYTNAKNAGFEFDGVSMYNVSDAGYLYENTTKYDYVYALVVDALAENELSAYEELVTVNYSNLGQVISYEKALDVNESGSVTWDDIISVYTVVEKDAYAFKNRMAGVIKADTNGDKKATSDDASAIISMVYGNE